MDTASRARVALSTAPDVASAERLARALVERRLAACVQLVPGATSIYRWQGVVESAAEILLVVKTRAECVAAIEALWRELHPYDVPELVVLDAREVEPRYLQWLLDETAAPDAG